MCQHMLPSWFWHYVLPLVVWDLSMLVTCFALRCVFGDVCEFTWHKTITKTITELTRKPSSNTMAHWSPCHGGSPQRGKPHPQLCWRQPQRWRQPANLKTLKKRSSSKHVVATCGYGELLQEAFLQQRYECPRSMEAERMIFWMAAACAYTSLIVISADSLQNDKEEKKQ